MCNFWIINIIFFGLQDKNIDCERLVSIFFVLTQEEIFLKRELVGENKGEMKELSGFFQPSG